MVGEGKMLEHAKVFDNFYGTPKEPVEAALKKGSDVMFDVDWQGTQQLVKNAPKDLVRVFIMPPSLEELEQRLRGRATDDDAEIQRRMKVALEEIEHSDRYDYCLRSASRGEDFANLQSIYRAEKMRNR